MTTFELDDQLPMPTPLVIRRFTREESPLDFDLALDLRKEVFVAEQSIPLEAELDEYDDEAIHWLILNLESLEILATVRMVSYQEGCQMRPVAKIGRIAVKQSARGKGLGLLIMREVLGAVDEQGYDQAILDAHVHLVPFYEKLGFVAEGDPFTIAGVSLSRMRYVRP